MDLFAQILFDLGKEVNTELYPDHHRLCQLNYNDELHLQLQHNETRETILIGAFLCEVPAGKYREKLFLAALNHNHNASEFGALAYSERNNQLTLFKEMTIHGLNGEKLFQLLEKFIALGIAWKEAVVNGKPFPIESKKGGTGSMFGMKS